MDEGAGGRAGEGRGGEVLLWCCTLSCEKEMERGFCTYDNTVICDEDGNVGGAIRKKTDTRVSGSSTERSGLLLVV